MIYEIEYKGEKVKVEKVGDKFKKPDIARFTTVARAVTWLDDCRIPYESEDDYVVRKETENKKECNVNLNGSKTIFGIDSGGRFPANLIVNDDVLNDGNITKSSKGKQRRSVNDSNEIWNSSGFGNVCNVEYNDKGSYSRYFSLDAWADKNLPELPENIQRTYPFMIVPKASKSEKNNGLDGLEDNEKFVNNKFGNSNPICEKCGGEKFVRQPNRKKCVCEEPKWKEVKNFPIKNNHPTTKPIKLMSYLITLGSRPNDVVLDPFLGSGTTGIAAKLLGRNFIGMELNEEYMKIAKERIKNFSLENKNKKYENK